jgi:hypothetical protein
MHKPIAVLLLILAATPYFYYGLMQHTQEQLKHEMEERLEQSLLQSITIGERDVKWAEEGKEIWVGDRLFDIKSVTYHNHHYIFTGLFDEKETALVKNVREQQQRENSPGSALIIKLFQVFGVCENAENNLATTGDINTHFFHEYSTELKLQFNPVPTPPPQG